MHIQRLESGLHLEWTAELDLSGGMLAVEGPAQRSGSSIFLRLTQALTRWVDRWIPPAMHQQRIVQLRARVLVVISMFCVSVSLPVQAIRLSQEVQHWVALSSWTLCTLLFILAPVLLRAMGNLAIPSIMVSLAMLVGAVGVAVAEGGVASPNTMVMIVGPAAAMLLGGRRSGAAIGIVVVVCSASLWVAHAMGLLSAESPLQPATLTAMRATLLACLSGILYLLTLFYEGERDRSESELSDKAIELARARDSVVETAAIKMALIASQHRELERDLQLTAAVQKLLLPKRDSLHTKHASLAGFSVSALEAGGDWWFAEALKDGTLRVLIGDVTGHGAAPAMVAAVVAGAFRAMQETVRLDGRQVLTVLHKVLLDVSTGNYTMPFGILELSPVGCGTWLSAAASPILILRSNGQVDTVSAPGTALGTEVLKLGHRSFELGPGERVLLSSDGVPELRMSNGCVLGFRRVSKLLKASASLPVDAARDAIAEQLSTARGDTALNDDVTFALIELRPGACREVTSRAATGDGS